MKKTNGQSPEMTASQAFRPKVRGILGAFLGALTAAFPLVELFFLGAEKIGGWAIFLGLLIGFGSAFGYWLFRGARERRFASFAVRSSAALAPFLAVPVRMVLYALRLMDWPAIGSPCFFQALHAGIRTMTLGRALLLAGILALPGLLSTGMALEVLLRYTDSGFRNDPRRIASRRAGGLLYNYWPEEGPDWQPLPAAFQVGGAGIQVTGDTIRTAPALRKGRTFTVWDAAGLIIGPSEGSCVIYGFQNQVLAKFGMARPNANLLVQLLLESGVPFYDCAGHPVEAPRTKAPRTPDDISFVVPMRSTALAMGVLGLCLAGSIVLALLVLALGASRGKPLPQVIIFFPLFGVLFPVIPLCAAGQLLPGLLAADKGRLYRQSIWTKKRRELSSLGALRVSRLDQSYVLYDKEGVILATFSGKSPHADQLLAYLAERHHIIPSGPGPEQERK